MPPQRIELGIDYGTATIIVFYRLIVDDQPSGDAQVVELFGGKRTTPSSVAFQDDQFHWGHDLVLNKVETGAVKAENVIQCAKLRLYDAYVQPHQSALADRVQQQLASAGKTIDDLLATHLTEIVKAAKYSIANTSITSEVFGRDLLGNLPVHANISVPQLWCPAARAKMQKAAKAAGIEIATLASEPMCAFATYADEIDRILRRAGHNSSPGDILLVLDLGSGTVDAVKFEQTTALGPQAQFKAVQQSAGSIGGSQQINEAIARHILAEIRTDRKKWPSGLEGVLKKLGDISEQRFRYHLDSEIENIKVSHADSQRAFHSLSFYVDGNANTEIFQYTLSRKDLVGALDEVIDEIVSQVKDMLRQKDDVHFILLSGGFSNCQYLRKRLSREFPGKVSIPLEKLAEPVAVAEGALSPRYDMINARDLPAGFSYAIVRDEAWDPAVHTDCLAAGSTTKPHAAKVGSYNPDKPNSPVVVKSRLKFILMEGQARDGTVEMNDFVFFYPRKIAPGHGTIEARLVYFKGKRFSDGGPALVDDYDANRPETWFLRDGLHEWKTVETRLEQKWLRNNKFSYIVDQVEGIQRWKIPARVTITYEKEQDMKVGWIVQNKAGEEFRITEESAWDGKRSDFMQDPETEDVKGEEDEDMD